MSNTDTLLSYLVPKLTSQVENAATDGLGYILRKSETAMAAFNVLLKVGGYTGKPIVSVEAQVTYDDGSRPDMAGYDEDGVKRLLVEAKFWAALSEDQAIGYLQQFDEPGPAMLFFIAPEARMETFWAEINRQINDGQGILETRETSNALRSASVVGEEKMVLLVSWRNLLGQLGASASADNVAGDIRQLRGLADRQDIDEFLPVHGDDVGPDRARRIRGYKRLAKEVVDRGVKYEWLDIKGLRVTPQWYGYGRFFRFFGVQGDFWIGVNDKNWAMYESTPLWLEVRGMVPKSMERIGSALKARVYDQWIPIHIKKGVEFHAVLDDVACQLKAIGRAIGASIPDD